METGIQTPTAQADLLKIILMMKWIRTSRSSINNSLSAGFRTQNSGFGVWHLSTFAGGRGRATSSLNVQVVGLKLETGIQTPMAQGRFHEMISMIKWIRTSRLSIKNSFSLQVSGFRILGLGSGVCHRSSSYCLLLSSLELSDTTIYEP